MNYLQLKTGLIFKTNDDYAFNSKQEMLKKVMVTEPDEWKYEGKVSGMIDNNGKSYPAINFSCNPQDIVAYWEDHS